MNSHAHPYLAALVPVLLALGACTTIPARDAALEDARAAVASAQRDPQVVSLAPRELDKAVQAMQRADAAWRDRVDIGEVHHLAYLARERAGIAVETARLRNAEAAVIAADAERARVRLEARTRQAEAAQRNAAAAQAEADARRREAQAATREAAAAQAQAQTMQQQAQALQQDAATSKVQAQEAEARSRALEAQLADLQAKKTERGMVVTLSDVLFDTGQSQLKPGGMRTLQKLADFMRRYPDCRVSVEGFTDSLGSETFNQELSERRANSVRLALIDMGIDPGRLSARGYGKNYPIASNDNVAGRQLNRRVEIVISDTNGVFGPPIVTKGARPGSG